MTRFYLQQSEFQHVSGQEISCFWAPVTPCDLLNWQSLIIEILIGTGFGVAIFFLQHFRTKKRKRYVRLQIGRTLADINAYNKFLDVEIQTYYQKTGDKNTDEMMKWLMAIKKISEDLRYKITIFSQELDEELISILNLLMIIIDDHSNSIADRNEIESFHALIREQIEECKKELRKYKPDAFEEGESIRQYLINYIAHIQKQKESTKKVKS